MISDLRRLTDADLRALAQALRSGRLFRPFSPITVGKFCATEAAGPLAASMEGLSEEGMRPEHLALVVEASLSSRTSSEDRPDLVELVWTGPEVSGMTNRDTAVVVRDLFASARREVLVAGYAVHQGREIFRGLAARMEGRPGLRVRMFLDVQRPLGDASPDREILGRFVRRFREQEWPGRRYPEVWYDPRSLNPDQARRSSLHAKCLVIDRRVAFVSSANFTEAAQVRNIEVGTLVHVERFAECLAQHFDALSEARELLPLIVDGQAKV